MSYGVRGFKVDGKTDHAVGLMKQIKIYPLSSNPTARPMEFFNSSGQAIDTVHADNFSFYEALAQLVNEEPADVFTPLERFYMESIGIVKGKPFNPTGKDKEILSEAARVAAAMARANSFASPDRGTYYYDDRQWQYVGDIPYTWMRDGVMDVDRRAFAYYMALGNSPAMMSRNVSIGSYYMWTYKDAKGTSSTARRATSCTSPQTFPQKIFGRCWCTTHSAVRSWTTDNPTLRSACTPVLRPTTMAQWMFTLGQRCLPDRKRTGYEPFPVAASSRCSGGTGLWRRCTTRPGNFPTSKSFCESCQLLT